MNSPPNDEIIRTPITVDEFYEKLMAEDYDFSYRIFDFDPLNIFKNIYLERNNGCEWSIEYEQNQFSFDWALNTPIFVLSRIFIGYWVYQTIAAFRKFKL